MTPRISHRRLLGRAHAPAQAAEPPPQPRPAESDAIGAWLGMLQRLLRVPGAESAALREELDAHLRERVRDLVLSGVAEAEAQRAAIEELGDAQRLADAFRAERTRPLRRKAMNALLLVVAGAAAITSAVALHRTQAPAQSGLRYYNPAAHATPPAPKQDVARHALDLPDMPFARAITEALKAHGLTADIRLKAFEEIGIDVSDHVTVKTEPLTLEQALRRISEARNAETITEIDVRISGKNAVVAPRGYFDRREITLAVIDISELTEAGIDIDRVCVLINDFAEPEAWVNNGGDLAKLSVVGDRMFIKAPPRLIEQANWFIDQLRKPAHAAADTKTVPILKDVPLLNVGKALSGNAADTKADGPIRFTAEDDVVMMDTRSLAGEKVRLKADSIEINPGAGPGGK